MGFFSVWHRRIELALALAADNRNNDDNRGKQKRQQLQENIGKKKYYVFMFCVYSTHHIQIFIVQEKRRNHKSNQQIVKQIHLF